LPIWFSARRSMPSPSALSRASTRSPRLGTDADHRRDVRGDLRRVATGELVEERDRAVVERAELVGFLDLQL
jgi:hypothetical protein